MYSTTILLCVPMIIAGIVLADTDCPFNALIACALLSGVGGGAFASSMSNISFYYPKRLQGSVSYNVVCGLVFVIAFYFLLASISHSTFFVFINFFLPTITTHNRLSDTMAD